MKTLYLAEVIGAEQMRRLKDNGYVVRFLQTMHPKDLIMFFSGGGITITVPTTIVPDPLADVVVKED